MKKILIGLFLVFVINAQAGNIAKKALFECENYRMIFKVTDDICPVFLNLSSSVLTIKKELNYTFEVVFFDEDKDTTTKQEKQQIKKAIESALLRYFSTPVFPKKIKEVKKTKDADVYVYIAFDSFNKISGIYYGEIEIILNGAFPLQFTEHNPAALNRELQFDYLLRGIDDIIKEMADEIFEMANKDLSLKEIQKFLGDNNTTKTKKPEERGIVPYYKPEDYIIER
ncbi:MULTISPECIES: hypothetical protein [Helicobacter]|uniref:hypothetical protein n=1 Tax=Helicobacter TaxID=209 RepID=UPI00262FD72B|nr:hypothetical protein [Helicobacter sp. UBA3407]